MSTLGLLLLCSARFATPSEGLEPEVLAAAYGLQPIGAPQSERGPAGSFHWTRGSPLLQGFFGASLLDKMERTGGATPPVEGTDGQVSQLPTLGGGAQWKLGGEKLEFGLEAMASVSWRARATAVAAGGGGAVIAVDVNLLAVEIYGGPVVNLFLGDRARVYASAGPLMEWTDYTQHSSTSGIDDSGSGFGTGLYARAGIEFAINDDTMLGFGVRYSESTISLDSGLGDLDLRGTQYLLTVTQGF